MQAGDSLSTDPMVTLRNLIKDNIDVKKDDDTTPADVLVEFEFPESKLKDFFDKYDLIVTVGRAEERDRRIGFDVVVTVGSYRVGVWAVDRTGSTGWKTRYKGLQEVRRIFREFMSGSWRVHKGTRDDDKLLGAKKLWHSIHTVEYWSFS